MLILLQPRRELGHAGAVLWQATGGLRAWQGEGPHRRKDSTVGKKALKSSQKPHISSANPAGAAGTRWQLRRVASRASVSSTQCQRSPPHPSSGSPGHCRCCIAWEAARRGAHLGTSSPTPQAPRRQGRRPTPWHSWACGAGAKCKGMNPGARCAALGQAAARGSVRRGAGRQPAQRRSPYEEAESCCRADCCGHAREEQDLQHGRPRQHGRVHAVSRAGKHSPGGPPWWGGAQVRSTPPLTADAGWVPPLVAFSIMQPSCSTGP